MSKNEKNKSNFNARQIMADAKFYEAYSRFNPVTNKYETWEEATKRVMNMHRGYLKDKLNVYSDELWSMLDEVEVAYRDKLILGAQRALQFGGDQLIKHQARMYNCFHPDTEFITDKGTFSFNDFSHGDEVKVLTHTGLWKKALVKSYGHQKLNLVELSKNTNTTEVRVTKDHRWILKDGTETTNLSIGDNLYKPENTFGQFNYYDADPLERLYWCYGMVYGDGTRIQDKDGNNKYSLIRLCNTDKQFAERFEEVGFKSSTNASLKGDFIAYTGTYLKTAPNPEVDSPELIRAFVAGYLQADGEKNNNPDGAQYKTIQSSEQDHIDFIRKCFPIAGVYIISETDLTGQETNYGTRPYTIRFRISDSFGSKYNSGWKVTNIKEDITENVWCLEVEDDKSFILPNGIVTGNCSASYCDRAAFFGEAFYLMLCGCGVGFSVQHHHVAKLPAIQARTSESVEFIVEDSIEGWAKAADVLMSSFFVGGGKHPEYEGKKIYFNLEKIRPKGSLISGGFKAPGPEPLRIALGKIEDLIKSELSNKKHRIRPIVAYDITMFIADAVISGGVRRSATICLFSKDDEDMLNAKTGDWYTTQQQRGRSNNSAVLLRDKTTLDELKHIMKSVKDVGEPGFIFADNLESLFNPCVEVGMRGYDDEFVPQEKAETGFQFCNLTEENGAKSTTKEIFFEQCKYASILGTVQAAYTDFKFVSQATINITMREALIGVGITGWMNNPDILFNPDIMREGANIVKYWNKKTAKLIGINQAARTTVVKPLIHLAA